MRRCGICPSVLISLSTMSSRLTHIAAGDRILRMCIFKLPLAEHCPEAPGPPSSLCLAPTWAPGERVGPVPQTCHSGCRGLGTAKKEPQAPAWWGRSTERSQGGCLQVSSQNLVNVEACARPQNKSLPRSKGRFNTHAALQAVESCTNLLTTECWVPSRRKSTGQCNVLCLYKQN
jgi:hypothetical protein